MVANTPDVLTRTTAELAITIMLALLRRVAEGDRMLRRHDPWGFSLEFMLGESLDGKSLCIVGPGRIGRETARLAEAFGAAAVYAGRGDPLPELFAAADIVSIHCPLTAETRHLVDADLLARMQADRRARQHRPRPDRRRGRARGRAPRPARSPAPRSTSSSSSPR